MIADQYIPERLAEAYHAAGLSPDPSNQNGAVIYNGQTLVAEGFNHIYPGIPPNYQDRAKKYERVVHAEHDVILKMAQTTHPVSPYTTLYCPWAACKSCAIAIIGSGIKNVVTHKQRAAAYALTRDKLVDAGKVDCNHWRPEIDEAMIWFRQAGVNFIQHDGPVPYSGPGVMINENLWHPDTCEFYEKTRP